MKEVDKAIYYRPELAKALNKDLNFMLNYYRNNFPQMYYKVLSIVCASKKDEKGEKLFEMIAGWYKYPFEVLELFEEHKTELRKYGILEPISDARAFCILNSIYDNEFETMKDAIDKSGLTKMESYMVTDFYRKCFAPLRNPNIQIKGNESKCYYDRDGHYEEFGRDLKMGIEFLTRECNNIIEIFNTED